VRVRLIRDHSVGTIAIPSVNALRIAYCSVAADAIPELAARIGEALGVPRATC
jgi:hypothetical protein